MEFFQNLSNNKLSFNDTKEAFVVFKIETTDNDKDLIDVVDFLNIIKWNHELLAVLEAIIENRHKHIYNTRIKQFRIPTFNRNSKIKLYRVSKQSPTNIELAVSSIQLGFNIAELLNELLQNGGQSEAFRNWLSHYNIPLELIESFSSGFDRIIRKLRPWNRFITIYYGININK
jgi:hypothetical protein